MTFPGGRVEFAGMRLPFKQVDVFTARAFRGNPVAVVLDADDVPAEEMQRIARWTNLSETTFVLRPTTSEADYRVRIFSPGHELPFAGHPTIGTAHAVIETGGPAASAGCLHQECGAGILPLRIERGAAEREIFVRVPAPKLRPLARASADALAAALGVALAAPGDATIVDVGPVWMVAELASRDALAALTPDLAALAALSRELGASGATVFARERGSDTPIAVRSFAPAFGVPEDPVCGSGNASVGAYLAAHAALPPGDAYTASQGTEIGRDGRVRVRVGAGGREIEIGGRAVTVVDGTITL